MDFNRQSKKSLKRNFLKIARLLVGEYPNKSGLNYSNNFELFVAVLLSAQCTDRKVNEVTVDFFNRFRNFEAVAKAPTKLIERYIKPINYYKTKAKHLKKSAKIIANNGFKLDKDFLVSLPGVGEKSAQVILACNSIPSFPVDTHVKRVATRLGLVRSKKPSLISCELKTIFPKRMWIPLHHAFIWHGRRVCLARNPRCGKCILCSYCPSCKTV